MNNLLEKRNTVNLSQTIRSATLWAFIGQVLLQLLSLSAIVVLGRLLSPEDFGVVAIAMVVWELIQLFGNLGVGSKLIQQADDIERYASAAFWLNIAIAVCLSLLTVIVAPFAASFYKNDLVAPVLMFLALGFVLNSFGTTHSVLLVKELDFKKRTVVDIMIGLITKSVTILMAFMGYGVWSLVIPQVLSSPVRVFALWKMCPWRPTMEFNFIYWKSIFDFGKYILGANLFRYISLNGDYMVIGKFLGSFELGIYTFAYKLAQEPINNIVWVVCQVCFPAFSKLQNDLNRFREVFLKMIRFISLISFPLFLGLLATANELIPFVFGDKWNRAIIPLQIIIGFSLIRSFASPSGGIVTALGKPNIEFTFNLIQAPLLLVGVLVGVKYGIIGVAVAMSLVVGIMALVFLKVSISLIDLRLRNIFEVLLPAFVSSSLMMTLVLIVRYILLNEFGYKDYQVLLVCVPFGGMIYLGILFLFFRTSFQMFWNIFMDILGNRLTGIKKIYPAFGNKTAMD